MKLFPDQMKTIECHTEKLYTAKEIAPLVGTSEKRIRILAKQRNVGQKIGKWGMWVFIESDIQKLKPGPNGRPPKL
jgi:hypothetical protein